MRSQPALGVCLILVAVLLGFGLAVFGKEQQDNAPIATKEAEKPLQITKPTTKVRKVNMLVTAYCLCEICCEKWADQPVRKTAIGDDAKVYDGVAADPKLLPYRTQLYIPGVGMKEVDDTGGAMRRHAEAGVYHIDIRMASHYEARCFGVKWLQVEILE